MRENSNIPVYPADTTHPHVGKTFVDNLDGYEFVCTSVKKPSNGVVLVSETEEHICHYYENECTLKDPNAPPKPKPRLNVLITGGNTQVPIDKVRCISNIFKGATGNKIADHICSEHNVTLMCNTYSGTCGNLMDIILYKTYDDLYETLHGFITKTKYDVIIHSAAVSDYAVDSVLVEADDNTMVKLDTSKKMDSSKPIYLKLTPTVKIVDKFREWGFNGKLIKFKLQVGKTDEELIEIAKDSLCVSDADMVVANCMEWSADRAILVTEDKHTSIARNQLSAELLKFIGE